MKATCAAVVLVLAGGCNEGPRPTGSHAPPPVTPPVPTTSASPPVDEHEAHPTHVMPPVPTVTSLSDAARAGLTAVRVSAHQGSVIIRKEHDGWVLAGARGCTVAPARMDSAFDNLGALKAVATSERPADGAVFELQIVALSGEERTLHFDVADRKDGRDLLQLPNQATYRLQGLDRELWSPDPQAWCGAPQ
jgi:hypothetical protein